MNASSDGGKAFPLAPFRKDGVMIDQPGMSLRDWLAGQALTGMIANPHNRQTETFATVASDAFGFADAMLAERRAARDRLQRALSARQPRRPRRRRRHLQAGGPRLADARPSRARRGRFPHCPDADEGLTMPHLNLETIALLREHAQVNKDFGDRRVGVAIETLLDWQENQFDLEAHLIRQKNFSLKTFGPGARTKGVIDHIRKELREIEAAPEDIEEWVDVIILAFNGAWRAGWKARDIIKAIVAKQTKNEGRRWPDWRTASPDKAIEHDRTSGD